MLVTLFLNGMGNNGLTREVCKSTEILEYMSEMGWQRLERVVITDFRVVYKEVDGKKIELCPDF